MVPDGSSSIEYSTFGEKQMSMSHIECAAWVSNTYPVKGDAIKFDAAELSCQALRYDLCPAQAMELDPGSSRLLIKDKPKKEG